MFVMNSNKPILHCIFGAKWNFLFPFITKGEHAVLGKQTILSEVDNYLGLQGIL